MQKAVLIGCATLLVGLIPMLLGANETTTGKQEDESTLKYVGNQACKECHPTAYKEWVGSKHARAYVLLAWGVSREMARENEEPTENRNCLRCHAPATRIAAERLAPGFHIEEGVKCESCHGPGEMHVAKQRAKMTGENHNVPRSARLKRLKKENCEPCHRPLASHEMLKKPPFDYEKAWAMIHHAKEKKAESADENQNQ